MYAELVCTSNFTFLTGASHPEELVARARELGYAALAITDECSLAGVVRAYREHQEKPGALKLIIGARFYLEAEPVSPDMPSGCRSDFSPTADLISGAAVGLKPELRPQGNLLGGRPQEVPAGQGKDGEKGGSRGEDNRDSDGAEKLALVLLATDHAAYVELSGLITLGRMRAGKGEYQLSIDDVRERIQRCLGILIPAEVSPTFEQQARELMQADGSPNGFHPTGTSCGRLWLGVGLTHQDDDYQRFLRYKDCADRLGIPLVAHGDVLMHVRERKPLLDVVTAIRLGTTVQALGRHAQKNAERRLRAPKTLRRIYPPELLAETVKIAERCTFSLAELKYEYPAEIIPKRWRAGRAAKAGNADGAQSANAVGTTGKDSAVGIAAAGNASAISNSNTGGASAAPEDCESSNGRSGKSNNSDSASAEPGEDREASAYLAELAWAGARRRWPQGIEEKVTHQIRAELALIRELRYEHFFLTVYDIVAFARSRHILCQGRGSAANSAVCFCLGITEVDPAKSQLLFERFLSRERNEPPDIDVDFEHERREEVIQYIYGKYGRHRAALAATVISYRSRSALRDVGKALGLDAALLDHLAKNIGWWDQREQLVAQLEEAGISTASKMAQHLLALLTDIRGFPRHLSQHVGGFIIAREAVSHIVPVENAAMPERSVIQWDKDDLETLGLLKVDVLALGMLTAIRKTFALIERHHGRKLTMATLPPEDPATYEMLCRADSVGVFQVESRAQMSMLPRLKPRTFYDLVVQVAIVRPGPVQGGMVHPYLARRAGRELIEYPDDAVRKVLERTCGVPIFQEQVIKMAMVAAGFTGGEADQLRRAMASWKLQGKLAPFEEKLKSGMLARGYTEEYAERIWSQIQGFGDYGFPESHAASFALLVYVSAWLKCHYPAEFCCGLLNSLPMGFYSPSQLIQDALRHGIEVRPVRIEHSHWDHALELTSPPEPDTVARMQRSTVARMQRSGIRERSPNQRHDPDSAALHPGYDMRDAAERDSGCDRHDTAARHPDHGAHDKASSTAPACRSGGLALRLGFRLVSGFNASAAGRIIAARERAAADVCRAAQPGAANAGKPFCNLQDLKERAALSRPELEALIVADALADLAGHRPQTQWEAAALAPSSPLLGYLERQDNEHLHDGVQRPAPSVIAEVLDDYQATGLTLKAHPMALLRAKKEFAHCSRAAELAQKRDGQFVRIAGVVTGRQRPGTASGIIFMTLEDETGNANIVVRVDVQERCRQALLGSRIALVKGVLENREGVVHVLAGQIEDVSDALAGLTPGSRDFH